VLPSSRCATVVVARGARCLKGWSTAGASADEQAGEERPSGDGEQRDEQDAPGQDVHGLQGGRGALSAARGWST
jgi:hypothetical protein